MFFKKKKKISEIEEELMNYDEKLVKFVLESKESVEKGETSQKEYEKSIRAMHQLVYGE